MEELILKFWFLVEILKSIDRDDIQYFFETHYWIPFFIVLLGGMIMAFRWGNDSNKKGPPQ